MQQQINLEKRMGFFKWVFTSWFFYLALIALSIYRIIPARAEAIRIGQAPIYSLIEIIIGNFLALICGFLAFRLTYRRNKKMSDRIASRITKRVNVRGSGRAKSYERRLPQSTGTRRIARFRL